MSWAELDRSEFRMGRKVASWKDFVELHKSLSVDEIGLLELTLARKKIARTDETTHEKLSTRRNHDCQTSNTRSQLASGVTADQESAAGAALGNEIDDFQVGGGVDS